MGHFRVIGPFVQGPVDNSNRVIVTGNPLNSLKIPAGPSTDEVYVGNPDAPGLMSVDSVGGPTTPANAHLLIKTRPLPPVPPLVRPQNLKTLPQSTVFPKNKVGQVTTPVKVSVLSTYLQGYPNRKYLINGFTIGFKLGYIGPRQSTSCSNLKSCSELPDVVLQKLQAEIYAKRIQGPFHERPFPNFHISPIGLVPKKTVGDFRLIHHLSHPKGSSINDHIDPNLATVKYASFDDAVATLLKYGPGCFFAKTDIHNAFRLIPIHPSDHELLGFSFQGKYYYDTCLPMGSSSSCSIFEAFSTSLQWIATNKLKIPHIVHILDDFLFFGHDFKACQGHLDQFLNLCKVMGVPIKQEKTESARQVIVFMGLELDSITMEARLPQDKLSKLRSLLLYHTGRRKITLKDLQSLIGLLNFCCSVVIPGRCFLRRLINLTVKVSKPTHRITMSADSRRDLKAWFLFTQHFNGKNVLLKQRWLSSPSLHLHTDAAGSLGYGAIFNNSWFYGEWPNHMTSFHITFKELFPIVLALEIWGTILKNKCIILHSDNYAVVHIINKQSCKDSVVMKLVRRLVLTCMQHNILIQAKHIPGKDNVLPDLLSRLQVKQFRLLAPQMDDQPTKIPEQLLLLH